MRVILAIKRVALATLLLALCASCSSHTVSTVDEAPAPVSQPDAAAVTATSTIPASESMDTTAEQVGSAVNVAPENANPITNRVAASETTPEKQDSDQATAEGDGPEIQPCIKATPEDIENWLNRTHYELYETVCSSIAWFDGFFGTPRFDVGENRTYGNISTSGFWDQRNGFEPAVRFRVRVALPALKSRTRLILDRGNEDSILQDREIADDTVPGTFNEVDDDLLIGLGYRRNRGLKRGFDLSTGVKIRTSPKLYSKAKYARAWEVTESTLFRFNPIVYWKSEEGFGATARFTADQLLSNTIIMRWINSVNASEDEAVEGFAMTSSLQFFQALKDRKALNYRAFVYGETKADEKWQNYGFEVRYRQRILREWLFVELVSSLTWPKFTLEEDRDSNIGVGAGLQMYFGPVPDEKLR
ncbi:MAG: hypothetical protein OEU86_00150 [Gammaproteobacteria bacterium]|nr:hypothetical protein [Gammaproteobacteria bacterium]